MKKIILVGLIINSVFGVELMVKKADVEARINTQAVHLQKGDTRTLEEGSTICFVEGGGKIVVPELKKQLKKPGRCLMVPISEGKVSSYMADLKNKATVAFWDSSESVRGGKGTKGETEFDDNGVFLITKDQQELLIFGKEFGPLPVLIVLKDATGSEIMSFENEESETTIVRIGRAQLKSGMRLDIYNGFEELMLSQKIVVEEN